ncbi:hypothetical protein ACX0G9_16265 [Flavitalea flava]
MTALFPIRYFLSRVASRTESKIFPAVPHKVSPRLTTRKRDVTGSTSTIKTDKIAKRPLVRVEQVLQGSTSGVVQSNSGPARERP